MSKLDSLFESKAMITLQSWGNKVQANKAISAVSSGMMTTMSLVLAGAIFSIVATVGSLFGVIQQTDAAYQWLMMPYNMTMGLLSVAVAFSVGYIYSRNLELKGEVANGLVALFLFLMVCSPVSSVTLEGGITANMMDTTYLGGMGLFTAMIVPIVALRVIKFCADHHVMIKMPDAVPAFLSESLASLVPLIINILFWCGLNTAVSTMFGMSIPAAIMALLSAPLGMLTSVPGLILLIVVTLVLWCLGIHGTAITSVVFTAPMIALFQQNAELVAAGMAPQFAPVLILSAMTCCGGTGSVLPLAVLCLRGKSERLKAVGKAGIVPALFNISEPILFGAPIMYNPILAIPFIGAPVITALLLYLGYSIGFFQPGYVLMMTSLPIFVGDFLSAMAWQNLFIPVVAFIVGIVCCTPFVRAYDRQCVAEEAALEDLSMGE